MPIESVNYSSIDPAMKCINCSKAQILQGPGGKTQILCRESDFIPVPIKLIVTACNRFDKIKEDYIFSKSTSVRIVREKLEVFDDMRGVWREYPSGEVVSDWLVPVPTKRNG